MSAEKTPKPDSIVQVGRAHGTAKPGPPAPTGPVLTVAQAKPALKPLVLACMRKHKVHSIQARLGNNVIGPVRLLGKPYSSRVDGLRSKITTTKLGRCIDRAGNSLRVRAFRSNYILLNLTNSSVRNPLANLPPRADRSDVRKTIDAIESKIRACARKHGEEGTRSAFVFTIDGPTGKALFVRALRGSKAFKRCAQSVYRALRFTKVQQGQHNHTNTIEL